MDMTQDAEGKYLKAKIFEEGTALTMTIKAVTREEFEDQQTHDKVKKAVLYFNEKKPGLVLNKTNAETLIRLFGKESDDWLGKAIRILVTSSQVGLYFKISDKRVTPADAARANAALAGSAGEAPL